MGWCIQEKGGENVVRQPEGSTTVLFFLFISNCVKTLPSPRPRQGILSSLIILLKQKSLPILSIKFSKKFLYEVKSICGIFLAAAAAEYYEN